MSRQKSFEIDHAAGTVTRTLGDSYRPAIKAVLRLASERADEIERWCSLVLLCGHRLRIVRAASGYHVRGAGAGATFGPFKTFDEALDGIEEIAKEHNP